MEVGEVIVYQREITTYSVKVDGPTTTITLNVDDMGVVKVLGHLLGGDAAAARFKLAEFNSAYLGQVHAAMGAVLEAMEGEG